MLYMTFLNQKKMLFQNSIHFCVIRFHHLYLKNYLKNTIYFQLLLRNKQHKNKLILIKYNLLQILSEFKLLY